MRRAAHAPAGSRLTTNSPLWARMRRCWSKSRSSPLWARRSLGPSMMAPGVFRQRADVILRAFLKHARPLLRVHEGQEQRAGLRGAALVARFEDAEPGRGAVRAHGQGIQQGHVDELDLRMGAPAQDWGRTRDWSAALSSASRKRPMPGPRLRRPGWAARGRRSLPAVAHRSGQG